MIRIRESEEGWRLAQVPKAQSALVSLDPKHGAIRALVGGMGFELSKFNRATQAKRQPGSNFKPFLYASALQAGITPSTVINDAPVVLDNLAAAEICGLKTTAASFMGRHGSGGLGLLTQSGFNSGVTTGRGQGVYPLR